MTVIEDGTGSGKKVAITPTNRMDVSSRSASKLFYSARDNEKAFSVYGKRNFAAADTNENILYIKYTGTNHCVLKK